MNTTAPVNPRIVCEPLGLVIPLELIYTGTRGGLDVWKNTFDVYLPQGTTVWRFEADTMPDRAKVDVDVGWEGQQ